MGGKSEFVRVVEEMLGVSTAEELDDLAIPDEVLEDCEHVKLLIAKSDNRLN